ncbi:MAG: hypothetical protein JWN04_5671 [Myxococcaceae bacterium]|nr:hypothetical protein [Myxococcaceae bacterium]
MIFRMMASGTGLALHLPKEVATRMRLTKGDGVYAPEIPKGYAITTFVEAFARDMDLSEADEVAEHVRPMTADWPAADAGKPQTIAHVTLPRARMRKRNGRRLCEK